MGNGAQTLGGRVAPEETMAATAEAMVALMRRAMEAAVVTPLLLVTHFVSQY